MGRTWTVGSSGCDYSTIGAAESGASSGDTLILMPETFTENPILNPGINIFSYGGTTIKGKCSMTGSGNVEANNITFDTNGDYAISVSGSSNSGLTLKGGCSIISSDHTAIQLSSTGVSFIYANGCFLNIPTSGYAHYYMSGGNNIHFLACFLCNSSNSPAGNENTTGNTLIEYSTCFSPITCTGTGSLGIFNCEVDTSAMSSTCVYILGTGSNVVSNCYLGSGVASPLYIGGSKVLGVGQLTLNTSAATYVGGGTLTTIREV